MSAIEREIFVRCMPAHAFATFTERIDAWWPRAHRRSADGRMCLEARVGGRFVEMGADGTEHRWGEVIEVSPGEWLRFTFVPGGGPRPTEVEVRFTPEAGGTRVQVVHRIGGSGLGDAWPQRAVVFGRNWDAVLTGLGSALGAG